VRSQFAPSAVATAVQIPFVLPEFPMQVKPGPQTELSSHDPPAPSGIAHWRVLESHTSPGPHPLLAQEAPTTGWASQVPQLLVFGMRQNAVAHCALTEHGLPASRGPAGG